MQRTHFHPDGNRQKSKSQAIMTPNFKLRPSNFELLKADRELIAELRRSVEGVAFDELPMLGLSAHDLDIEAAQEVFGDNRKLDEQALMTLKLLARHQNKPVPTKGGILLFGRQRTQHFSDAWIQCGRFFGTEKIDIFDHIDIDMPLPKAVDEVMLFLKKHAYRGADLSEVRRKDVWSIPLGILREVIIKAVKRSWPTRWLP
jgi:ATP-dependent DNA helicase RecG